MTNLNLLDNLPIEDLKQETDYLGLIEKGDLIKTFLKGNKDQFDRIKMFSLYGEWGSGKSTLMKYSQKELDAEFIIFFFEAWQYEKDDNLAMSLLEFMMAKNVDTTEEVCKDVVKFASKLFKGLGKSVKLNIPLYPGGPSINFDSSKVIEEFEKQDELTFHKALEGFKTEFVRFEDNITRKGKKYNIVFIDDLDRCEPEQVLNLLSAIKLFFTYGQKTIFFCGIDKKAAEEAVRTKYGEVVKSNEYLEKIFDISFTMPQYENLQNLIDYYFTQTDYIIAGSSRYINFEIHDFFQKIGFTNPRRVKKVLNKYQMLRNIKIKELLKKDTIPNIDVGNGTVNSLFETILVLYMIILHEFYPLFFKDFLNFKKKVFNLNNMNGDKKAGRFSGQYMFTIEGVELSRDLFKYFAKYSDIHKDNRLLITICPTNFESIISKEGWQDDTSLFTKRFLVKDKSIELDFYEFIISDPDIIFGDKKLSKATFSSVKKLIERML